METWASQDELGKELGIDAQAVGGLLEAAGLKVGREASDEALERGLARPGTSPLGRPLVRWHASEVLPVLEPLVQRLAAAPAPQEPKETRTGTRRRTAAPKETPQVQGTTFDVVVALHAVAEQDAGSTGWAYVDQRTRETTSGVVPEGTETAAELVAALHLLEHSAPGAHLLVRSASEDLVKTATLWGPRWRRNGWRKRDGQTPDNVDLIEPLLARIEERSGRTRFGLGTADDQLILAAARAAVAAARHAGP